MIISQLRKKLVGYGAQRKVLIAVKTKRGKIKYMSLDDIKLSDDKKVVLKVSRLT